MTEAFLAQKHTDGRRCRHVRTAHADIPRRGVVGRKRDYDVRITAPEEASLRVEGLGLRA